MSSTWHTVDGPGVFPLPGKYASLYFRHIHNHLIRTPRCTYSERHYGERARLRSHVHASSLQEAAVIARIPAAFHWTLRPNIASLEAVRFLGPRYGMTRRSSLRTDPGNGRVHRQ
jgi:hypothetical protein